jgi:glycosyltransferase involved in cell wall biosynthesis
MKVAFISFDFGEYCMRLASALSAHANVLLLLPNTEEVPHMRLPLTLNYYRFTKPRLRQVGRQIGVVADLARRIRAFKPDVVHIQHGHLWFNFALPFLKPFPLVLTVHDAIPHPGDEGARNTPQVVTRFGFRRADRLIVHGNAVKELMAHLCRIHVDIVDVIPHIALGQDQACPDVIEREYQILFFGRIWGYKGLEYLIRAEPLITRRFPQARIVIAGEGENFEKYRCLIRNPNQFLILNEFISPQKQAELFRESSIVVLPYIEASQSGVIPIAYTFAKPVVATAVGALPEMVEHGSTGFLVPPRNPSALAHAINTLLSNRDLRRRMGANGKRKIESECAPQVIARKTLAVYHKAIAQRDRIKTAAA